MAAPTSIRISLAGIVLGSAALLIAVVHFYAGPLAPQSSLERTVAETAVAIRDAAAAALRGEEAAETTSTIDFDIDRGLSILAAVLGASAVILGVFGFAKGEPFRAAGGAATLGAGAIAFQFAVVALGTIVLVMLIAAVISQHGIG